MAEKWDCKQCGCTYDEEIEKEPKSGICFACRGLNKKEELKNEKTKNI